MCMARLLVEICCWWVGIRCDRFSACAVYHARRRNGRASSHALHDDTVCLSKAGLSTYNVKGELRRINHLRVAHLLLLHHRRRGGRWSRKILSLNSWFINLEGHKNEMKTIATYFSLPHKPIPWPVRAGWRWTKYSRWRLPLHSVYRRLQQRPSWSWSPSLW